MKWLILAVYFVCLARLGEGGALKCQPGVQDASCLEHKNEEKELPAESPEEVAVGEAECLAGTEWESNCHYCRCSDSGVAECLKWNTCDKEVIAEPVRCKTNTTFKRDCNSCVCLGNGFGICTLEDCQISKTPVTTQEPPTVQELPSGKYCEPGTSWSSRCNNCHCSSKGYPMCTLKACLAEDSGTDSERMCAIGSRWKDECNTCWCTDNGVALCTRLGCHGKNITMVFNEMNNAQKAPNTKSSVIRKTRAAPPEVPKTCQPGQEFRMDCNKCLCDNLGQDFSCTRIDCTSLNNNGGNRRKRDATEQQTTKCTPGTEYKQDCNVCRCSTDGHHATCSLAVCSLQNNDVSEQVSETDSNFRCNPGEQFKRGCNDCTCSADGKSTFCTLRLCDNDLTPNM